MRLLRTKMRMEWSRTGMMVLVMVGLLAAPMLSAQEQGQTQKESAENATKQGGPNDHGRALQFELQLEGHIMAASEFDTNPGEHSLNRGSVEFGISYQVSPRWQLKLETGLAQSSHDFESTNEQARFLTEPGFEDFEQQRISLSALYIQSPRFIWFAGVSGVAGTDTEADVNDALLLGANAGLIWRKSDRFSLILGGFFQEELDGDDQVLPYIGFQWRIQDDWRFNLGPDLELVYDVNPKWSVGLKASYEQRDYLLSERSIIPGGSLEDDRILSGAALAWKPSKSFKLELRGGMSAFGELEIKDQLGRTLVEEEPEAAAFGKVNLTFRF